jgi:C4-dicarboxylate-specific signal transduction histidine kinase
VSPRKSRPTAVSIEQALAASRAEVHRLRTELRETRDLLIQLGKMNELGRMTASLIHEINQPLAGIKSFAQMVRRKMTESDSQLAKIVAIEEQTSHIESLIDRLRRFSRQERLVRDPIDVHGPLESALTLLEHRIRKKGITVDLALAANLPSVAASSNHLQQVFVNLLVNACDALDNALEKRIVIASSQPEKERVEVIVGDSGHGVSPENRAKIFEYFFTTKPEDRGTGIGLAICREILHGYGGSVELLPDSTALSNGLPPMRTLFAVRIPVWHPAGAPAPVRMS